jgi:hypothetical protein
MAERLESPKIQSMTLTDDIAVPNSVRYRLIPETLARLGFN